MKTLREILALAAGGSGGAIAVAAAHDSEVLAAAAGAERQGLARPILVGDTAKIDALLSGLGCDPGDFERVPADSDEACAKLAVALVRDGRAGALMKGLLPTGALMRAVIDPEHGLRTGRLLSHCMFYEVPGHDRLLLNTDGGLVTFPDLGKKAGILENAAATLRALGYGSINAACICGAEAADPKIQSTLDAQALAGMAERWRPYNMRVFGPVGLDLAISPAACQHKGYTAEGAGMADILLVPTYEVGNALGKALTYFAGAKSAGIVVGAAAPIVLVSRADSAETKLASIALAAAVALGGHEAPPAP